MARVVVVRPRTKGKPKVVTLELLRNKGPARARRDIELAWRAGQSSALDHWDIAKGQDVGTVTALKRDGAGKREDVPYDVTFAFVVYAFHPEVSVLMD